MENNVEFKLNKVKLELKELGIQFHEKRMETEMDFDSLDLAKKITIKNNKYIFYIISKDYIECFNEMSGDNYNILLIINGRFIGNNIEYLTCSSIKIELNKVEETECCICYTCLNENEKEYYSCYICASKTCLECNKKINDCPVCRVSFQN